MSTTAVLPGLPAAPAVGGASTPLRTSLSASPLASAQCEACPLLPHRKPVLGTGPTEAALVVIGEAPGRQEELAARPFIGPSGQLLDAVLEEAGTTRAQVYTTNLVACRPRDAQGNDAPPPKEAVACCRPRLLAELRQVQPKLILSLGASAAKGLLGTNAGISKIHGVVERRPELPAPVLPTYHPAAVLHGGGGEEIFDDLLAATKRAVKIAQGELTIPDREEEIRWQHLTTCTRARQLIFSTQHGKGGYTLALDVETTGLDVISGDLLQVALGNCDQSFVIEADALKHPWVIDAWRDLLRDPRFTWLIHNSSFDLQWLQEHFGVTPPNVVDTMCLALGTTERKGAVGLKRLAREWLNAPYYEEELQAYLDSRGNGWDTVPRPVLARYAARDVVYTARMYDPLTRLCQDEGTLGLAEQLLMPAQRMFAQVERHGVLIDQTYLATLEAEWAPKVEAAAQAVADYAQARGWHRRQPGKRVKQVTMEPRTSTKTGKPLKPKRVVTYTTPLVDVSLNPRSPAQLAAFLFDHLKLRPPNGERTTGDKFREAYPDHPFTKLHGEFQLMNRMLTTYVRGIADDIRADGRVHPNFSLQAAVTGRLAITNPALQTIPREGTVKEGFASIKRIFVPSPGHSWVSCDYAQLEVRVAWHLTGDEGLGQAIMSGDFHRAIASKVFRKPPEQITEDERHASKRISFGIMYGRQAPAIAAQLEAEGIHCSIEDAQSYVDEFFAAAPAYRDWYRAQHRNALTIGRSTTPFGRVRRWHLITRENKQNVLNQAVNFPIQSTASDLCLRAAIEVNRIFAERRLGHVLFLVHDAIESEVREGREAEAIAVLHDVMTRWPWPSPATLAIDVKVGDSWGTTKPWTH